MIEKTNLAVVAAAIIGGQSLPMIQRANPPSLHRPPGYHHVTIVQPGVTVHLAGQCPLDKHGELVGGGDVVAQTEQVARNIEAALTSAGATPSDVVRAVIYVASQQRESLADAWRSLTSSPVADAFSAAATLLGVAQLGYVGQLVEVDITAALPA
jgi:enamine deaminase RidA (YjgF/YER057c/UK114 family)